MTQTLEAPAPASSATTSPNALRAYRRILTVTAVGVLLQGLWAGLFLQHDGQRDAAGTWIDVHARGADLCILLAANATVLAFITLRPRKDLWFGGAVLTALLVFESYLGGLIRDAGKDTLTAVHVPLALLLTALVVVLPLRARDT